MLETKPGTAASGANDSRDRPADNVVSTRDTLEHGWRYFALHAEQRMTMFSHFLVLFGLVAAGLAGCLQAQGSILRLVGAGLGVALVVIARVFRQIDDRTSFFVKRAEDALGAAESAIPVHSRLFQREPAETSETQLLKGVWTHGKSLRTIFYLAQGVGAVGTLLALALWIGS